MEEAEERALRIAEILDTIIPYPQDASAEVLEKVRADRESRVERAKWGQMPITDLRRIHTLRE